MDHFKSEICAEINSRIANLFFENQEKSKSEKLAEEMQISKQYDFFDSEASPEREDDLPSEGETENKLKDIKKDYEEPVLETATENEEKTEKDDQKFFETEQKIKNTDFEATKDKVIKGIVETIDGAVKGEEPLKQDYKDLFICDDDHIFNNDEITPEGKKIIMNIIDQTYFNSDKQICNGNEDGTIEIVDENTEIKKRMNRMRLTRVKKTTR